MEDRFEMLWCSFGDAWGVPWGAFWSKLERSGVFWGSGGVPGVSWGVLGGSLGFLVASGAVSGIFREIMGDILEPFWDHFGHILRSKVPLEI